MANVTFPKYFYEGQVVIPAEGELGSVWLSGVHFAMDPAKLSQNKIVAVLSAAELGLSFPSSIKHCTFDLKDCEEEEIRHVFYPAIRFIEQHRKNGSVLIHCAAGISRSASVLMAYMMHRYQGSYESCLAYIIAQRPCVMPNRGFRKQLLEFSVDLGVKDGVLRLN